MQTYTYKGKTFEFFHLNALTIVSLDSREYLCQQAAEMYVDKERKRNIKVEDLEGVIRSTGKSFHLGYAYGKLFEGEAETDNGKVAFSFLTGEWVNPDLN